MRATLGLWTCFFLTAYGQVTADEPTEKMTKIVVRDTTLGNQPGPNQETIYQVGSKLERCESGSTSDPKSVQVTILNNTDFWSINLSEKTALHQEDVWGFGQPINNVIDSKCWRGNSGPKLGHEISYFKENRAKERGREKIGATECVKQTLDDGELRFELWLSATKAVPVQVRVHCQGKLIRELRYDEYTTGLEIKPELFRVPAGFKVTHERSKYTAPVIYAEQMLVLVCDEGAAAVIFPKQTEKGVKYRYRYESKDGKTTKSGEGAVFEKEGVGNHLDTVIKAGPIELDWSHGGEGKGWIYYAPEITKVHLANTQDFEDHIYAGVSVKKLDLKRFMK